MNDLIRLALQKMRKAEQYVSYLYPYSIPYYRRKGWEIMSDHITFTLKDTEIPETVEVPGHVERLPVGDEDVKGTYDRFARCTHGALIRNDFEWMEYWRWENEEERTAAVYTTQRISPRDSCSTGWRRTFSTSAKWSISRRRPARGCGTLSGALLP